MMRIAAILPQASPQESAITKIEDPFGSQSPQANSRFDIPGMRTAAGSAAVASNATAASLSRYRKLSRLRYHCRFDPEADWCQLGSVCRLGLLLVSGIFLSFGGTESFGSRGLVGWIVFVGCEEAGTGTCAVAGADAA